MIHRTASLLMLLTVLAGCGREAHTNAARDPEGCPGIANPDAGKGWDAYRNDDLAAAQQAFQAARDACPSHLGARAGLGYVALREGELEAARTLFREVVQDDPANVDALEGLALLAWREGDLERAGEGFRKVLELDPEHQEARSYLERMEKPDSAGA